MVPLCVEWRCETDNWATTPIVYCSSTASLPLRPHCTNARQIRCQADLISFPPENWRRPSGCPHSTWMKTIQQDLKSMNLSVNENLNRHGSESSTLEIDVYVWRYALIVVHARKERMNERCQQCEEVLKVITSAWCLGYLSGAVELLGTATAWQS